MSARVELFDDPDDPTMALAQVFGLAYSMAVRPEDEDGMGLDETTVVLMFKHPEGVAVRALGDGKRKTEPLEVATHGLIALALAQGFTLADARRALEAAWGDVPRPVQRNNNRDRSTRPRSSRGRGKRGGR